MIAGGGRCESFLTTVQQAGSVFPTQASPREEVLGDLLLGQWFVNVAEDRPRADGLRAGAK